MVTNDYKNKEGFNDRFCLTTINYLLSSLPYFLSSLGSGKHQKPIKGINLITLYYTDINGISVPVNYRIYNKGDGKTKNDYLREMVDEVSKWGIKAKTITTDSWVEGVDSLRLPINFAAHQ